MSPVYCFHGFWGVPEDFNFLQEHVPELSFKAVAYNSPFELGPDLFLSDWGLAFRNWRQKQRTSHEMTAVGYSQGGRLLLQALQQDPQTFKKLVLISSHPGLQTTLDREQRLKNDREWAKKFRTLDWKTLQTQWNNQEVFRKGQPVNRLEEDFERENLALCLENWSLAHQPDFRDLILSHRDKVKIIVGEYDYKYIALYEKMKMPFQIAKGAAHRVPSDQPKILAEILKFILK